MKRTLFILGMAVALVGFMAFSAQATPITGSIGFAGSYTLSGGSTLDTASTIVMTPLANPLYNAVVLGTTTDSYATVPQFTPVQFSDITYVPPTLSNPLWQFSVGSTVYTFDATSFVVASKSSTSLVLDGTGTAMISGFTDTPGFTWTFTANAQGANLTWSDSTTSTVPEPSTLLLLGVGLFGLGLYGLKRRQEV